jgi:hypothetical protein
MIRITPDSWGCDREGDGDEDRKRRAGNDMRYEL